MPTRLKEYEMFYCFVVITSICSVKSGLNRLNDLNNYLEDTDFLAIIPSCGSCVLPCHISVHRILWAENGRQWSSHLDPTQTLSAEPKGWDEKLFKTIFKPVLTYFIVKEFNPALFPLIVPWAGWIQIKRNTRFPLRFQCII